MAKWATYNGDGGMTITGAEERSRSLGKGSRVDLDEVIVPARAGRAAQTLGDAVAADIHLFVVDEPAAESSRGRRHEPKPEPKPDVETV